MIAKFQGKEEFRGHRFHLRIDESGSGVLMIDASKLIFLNGTAVDYVKCILSWQDERRNVKHMRKLYRKLSKAQARDDFLRIRNQLLEYVKGEETAIEIMMNDDYSIGAQGLTAPYRMDLALTYHCQNDCGHCYNENREMRIISNNTISNDVPAIEDVSNKDILDDVPAIEGASNKDILDDVPAIEGASNENTTTNHGSDISDEQSQKEEGAGELTPEEWEDVLETLWDYGIPHIVFTGGEPTMSPHLSALIRISEELGQITGLITNGRKMREPGYLKGLVDAGLDHIQITVLSHRESVHDSLAGSEGAWKETMEGLKVALSEDLYVVTNTTILRSNIEEMEDTLLFLIKLGVKNIAFNSIIRSGNGKHVEGVDFAELHEVLIDLEFIAQEHDINLVWYTPTPYCELDPVNLGFGVKQCTACTINMAIEPDGSVLPCQSYYQSLGNILKDQWEDIWDHDICKKIRDRSYAPEKCKECEMLSMCGGGCPLSIEHGDYLCMDRSSSG